MATESLLLYTTQYNKHSYHRDGAHRLHHSRSRDKGRTAGIVTAIVCVWRRALKYLYGATNYRITEATTTSLKATRVLISWSFCAKFGTSCSWTALHSMLCSLSAQRLNLMAYDRLGWLLVNLSLHIFLFLIWHVHPCCTTDFTATAFLLYLLEQHATYRNATFWYKLVISQRRRWLMKLFLIRPRPI